MTKNIFLIISFLTILIISCNPAPEYNLNISPPPDNSWPEDIYPPKIKNEMAVVKTKEYGGTEALYGNDKSIYVARLSTTEEAISFFQKNITPEFESLTSNYIGEVDGQFYARANSNGKKYFGWVNHRYIFVLKATSDKAFSELLDNFTYISRK